ncbi:unnamed protein product, partial [Coregonus sp. 'balchen']
CSVPKLKRSVLSTLPVLSWLPHYSVRDNGLGDLISGISVGIMHLPQGTFAVISIMIGSVTEKLAPDSDFTFLNGTNGTAVLDVAARDAYRVQIAASTTVLSGLFQVLLGIVRFGFVVTYLSEPLIIAATLISYYCNLNSQYDVAVVGEIPRGLKSPSLPDVSLWGTVVGDAFAVAIELVALGLSNTVGGFFQCYSVTSSMSRSLIQESTGGKTQAVLSCIVFVNLKGIFKQYLDIPALWKSNKVDLLVWLVTLACTILLNLDLGLAASIAFSLLTVIFRTQLPRYSILGQVPGTELYLDTDTYEEAKEIPGITIFRSSTTVYYTNAELYLDALQEKVKGVNGHLHNGTVHPEDKVDVEKGNRTDVALTDRPTNGQVNWAYEQQGTGLDPGYETVCVVEQLSRAGFFSESIPKSRLFTTVHDAVLHSLRLQGTIYECALDMACTTKM